MTTTEKPVEKADEPVLVPALEPDPLWDARAKAHLSSRLYRVYVDERADGGRCSATNAEDQDTYEGDSGVWGCNRGDHPDHFKHLAMSGDYVIGFWGGTDPKELPTEMVEADPDPEPFELEIGKLYKFRNRPTVLQVMGVRKDGAVEVVDLTHQRYRVLKREQLVPRKADAEPLTVEQIMWLGKFMAERREQVRENALKQRRDGYFKNAKDLNKILAELKLEPYRPKRAGTFQPELQIKTVGLTDSETQRLLADWFSKIKLPDGIELVGKPGARSMYLGLRDS